MNFFTKDSKEEILEYNLKPKTLVFINFGQYFSFLKDNQIKLDFKFLKENVEEDYKSKSEIFCNLFITPNSPREIFSLKKWLEMAEGFQVTKCSTTDEFLMFMIGKISTNYININGDNSKSIVLIDDFNHYTLSDIEKLLKIIRVEIDRKVIDNCVLVTSTNESKEHLFHLKSMYRLPDELCYVISGEKYFDFNQ